MNTIKKYFNKKLITSLLCISLFGYSQYGFAGNIDITSYWGSLSMTRNTITQEDTDQIISTLQALRDLSCEQVLMRNVRFMPETFQKIALALKDKVVMNIDIIECTGITVEDMKIFADVVKDLRVKRLHIFDCEVSNASVIVLADAMRANRFLGTFDLTVARYIDNASMKHLVAALAENRSLQDFLIIDICWRSTGMSDENLRALAQAIRVHPSLTQVQVKLYSDVSNDSVACLMEVVKAKSLSLGLDNINHRNNELMNTLAEAIVCDLKSTDPYRFNFRLNEHADEYIRHIFYDLSSLSIQRNRLLSSVMTELDKMRSSTEMFERPWRTQNAIHSDIDKIRKIQAEMTRLLLGYNMQAVSDKMRSLLCPILDSYDKMLGPDPSRTF